MEPLEKTIKAFPSKFFSRLLENTDANFVEAATLTGRHIDTPERANMLGQLRHARLEAGFREAAKACGLTAAAPHTSPRGGRYSIVSSDGVYLIRSNVQTHCGPPRATKFRTSLALLNEWLSPIQLNMLMPPPVIPDDRLCGMLVVTATKRGDITVPAFVGIGFPQHDLSGWIELKPLTSILALYNDADTASQPNQAATVPIKDNAVPKLKKRPAKSS